MSATPHLKKANAAVKKQATHSVIELKRSTDLTPLARMILMVKAGGRCEFAGCNDLLIEHHLTLSEGNFAQLAHIVAFREAGPRGRDGVRPTKINDASNLMVLCPKCHKEIDDHPDLYPRPKLEQYKQDHEDRIANLTSLGPEYKTAVLVLKTNVANQPTTISFSDVREAAAPYYPVSREMVVIDLTDIPGDDPGLIETGKRKIDLKIAALHDPAADARTVGRLSIFALAPIPLLVHLGRALGNKTALSLYQRHRDNHKWVWKDTASPVVFELKQLQHGASSENVALCLSVSGEVRLDDLPMHIDASFSVYAIVPSNAPPGVTLIQSRIDLENFRGVYRTALTQIRQTHGSIEGLHLFPAVPSPVAILCGSELLPKVDPALLVYDYNKQTKGFSMKLEVGHDN